MSDVSCNVSTIKYKSYVNYNNYNDEIQTLNECTTNRNYPTIQQNMLIIYSNVDCLPNKIQELNSSIKSSEKVPDIIVLTEVKNKRGRKNYNYTDELKIDGYRLFSNNLLRKENRGIIVYGKQDLKCKQVSLNNSFMEYVLLEIETDHKVMHIAAIYRSPKSSLENSLNMCSLIGDICTIPGYKLFLGDFNFPKIDWKNHMESKNIDMQKVNESESQREFIATLIKYQLKQHIKRPTRARGNATPHIILDLVMSNESFIENIEFDAPLGKSDHSIIRVSCKVNPKISTEKESWTKPLDHVDLEVKKSSQKKIDYGWNIL